MRKTIVTIMSGICMMPLLTACGKQTDTMKSADIFAMDTYMNLKAYGRDAEAAVAEAEARIYELEQIFSVTNEASDIWKINHAGGQSVTASFDTVSVLQTAQRMNRESGGALCISLYPVLRTWGFTTGEYRIPAYNEIAELLQYADDTKISVSGQRVQYPEKTEIDLGAVAKGYTGDAVMEIMREHYISSAIINLGGNVQTLGSKTDGSAWTVGITDPFAPDSLIGTVSVTDKAVITSGNYERYFTGDDGQKYWHILDPATGCPANNGLVSVTVIGDCGAECDALSTALFVEGTEQAVQHWRNSGDFEMILVTPGGDLLMTEGIAADYTAKKDMPAGWCSVMKSRKILIIVLLIILVSACLSVFILRHSDKQTVEIVQDGTVLYTFDLNDTNDQIIRIPAPDGGYNLIKISDHSICISEADCPDQTCVHMGTLQSDYLPIVCLPHKLIVRFAEDTE